MTHTIAGVRLVYPRLSLIAGFLCVGMASLLRTAVPATDSPVYEVYTVQENESITSIAFDYQLAPELVARYNQMQVTDALKPGTALLIPVSVPLRQQSIPVPAPTAIKPSGTEAGKPALPAPQANQILGYYATVVTKNAIFRTTPNGGVVLCDSFEQGKPVLVIGQTNTHYAVLMADGSTGWVPRLALEVSDTQVVVNRPTPTAPVPAQSGRRDIVETAFQYMGIPYVYGGRLPDSLDCSLLVQTVFKRHGINLPRTAAQQFQVGIVIDPASLIPGDRLYFFDPKHTYIGHTGIYIGDGRFIHASSNRGQVAIDELSNPTYAKKFAGARR